MKALIVPGITDMNKGDQALVWETYRLLNDTKLFTEVCLLSNGDTREETSKLTNQSTASGYKIIPKLIPHPRRGEKDESTEGTDTAGTKVKMIARSVLDYLRFSSVLVLASYPKLSEYVLSHTVNKKLRKFQEFDVICVKGGGFLHAHGEWSSAYVIWYFLFYIKLAKKLGKKVLIMPNSFGPFIGLTVRRQLKKHLSDIDIIYARENISADALGLLLDKRIDVRKDLGFFLEVNRSNVNRNVDLSEFTKSEGKKFIGVTMRPWRFPGSSNSARDYDNYIQSYIKAVGYLVDKGFNVVLFNQSIGPNAHEDDRLALKRVADYYQHSNLVHWLNEDLTCSQLKYLYGQCHIFIGTRFHSVIFALTSGVPSIAIGYGGNKALGIMKSFDLAEFHIPIGSVTDKKLINTIEKVLESRSELRDQILAQNMNLEEERIQILNEVISYLQ